MSSLTDLGIVCALGTDKEQVLSACLAGNQSGLIARQDLHPQHTIRVGQVCAELPDMQTFDQVYRTRCNQLILLAYQQIAEQIKQLPYPSERIAVVIGTSTSGIASGEQAMSELQYQGQFPAGFDYALQEMNASAEFLAQLCGARGPVYTVSTACSSSGKAMISARHLLASGLVDAVITGGADSLCKLTVNGFASLESVASDLCNPFAQQRDGINIGEGAALFIMQRIEQGICLAGFGESSDAYHISAPEPQGTGAISVIQQALTRADMQASEVDYINLHGTGTLKNDEMEALAINQLLKQVPCSSTKSLTGHALGAAGAIEAAICWLLLSDYNRLNQLPGNRISGQFDPDLAEINLLAQTRTLDKKINTCLSNSFAFGGSNVALLLSRQLLSS
ncbi:beta-ketoacyl-ACP synthase [Neptunicella sp. SCSIO 80796]|uniref:beta-ketoacyl-ACP synthase n=1 Tax=Neptunicella plasticusilytica TaxID=3117012 RepID=UPI003A4E44A4